MYCTPAHCTHSVIQCRSITRAGCGILPSASILCSAPVQRICYTEYVSMLETITALYVTHSDTGTRRGTVSDLAICDTRVTRTLQSDCVLIRMVSPCICQTEMLLRVVSSRASPIPSSSRHPLLMKNLNASLYGWFQAQKTRFKLKEKFHLH